MSTKKKILQSLLCTHLMMLFGTISFMNHWWIVFAIQAVAFAMNTTTALACLDKLQDPNTNLRPVQQIDS